MRSGPSRHRVRRFPGPGGCGGCWPRSAGVRSEPAQVPAQGGASRTVFTKSERSYVFGYNAVMSREAEKAEELPEDQRPFAYEGAAAACTLLDLLTLTRGRRLHELLAGPAQHHRHDRLPRRRRAYALLRLRRCGARAGPIRCCGGWPWTGSASSGACPGPTAWWASARCPTCSPGRT
ncbi:DUF1702 family protein, partial [Nonomuraea rubra]|uniref:DUF1702 family protein n=1 Tax=Nonomuraea rubra TaxID=46180 RepID=UPI003CD05A2E